MGRTGRQLEGSYVDSPIRRVFGAESPHAFSSIPRRTSAVDRVEVAAVELAAADPDGPTGPPGSGSPRHEKLRHPESLTPSL